MIKNLVKDPYKNEEKIFNILVNESEKLNINNTKNTFFYNNAFEISFALSSNKELWWKFYTYFNRKSFIEDEYDNILSENGIVVVENVFSNEQVESLKKEWERYFSKFVEVNDYEFEYARRHDAVFKKEKGIDYTFCSDIVGKKRIYIRDRKKILPNFKVLLEKNQFFIKKIKNYFNIKYDFQEDVIMAEHLYSPVFSRKDKYWHIDNLKDQMKVMIILDDVKENDGPFTYVAKSHNLIEKYKNRYHQMYKMVGFKTTPCNHFEEEFLYSNNIQSALLKKGDVVIFDTRIHHTATFPYNEGERKNIVLYFDSLPTVRNLAFAHLDKYKDVKF